MSKSKAEQAQIDESKDESIRYLRKVLKRGSTVYTVLNHVSSSGMSRRISFFIVRKDRIENISGYVGHALGLRRNDSNGALIVGGCGMDMGFHVVHNLSYALHGHPKHGDQPQTGRAGTDRPGYTLKHEWL